MIPEPIRPSLPAAARGRVRAAALLLGLVAASGCTPGAATPTPGAPTAAAEPTPVARLVPTPTPTAAATPDPWSPVGSESVAGVVVPAGAELVGSGAADADSDARADYRMPTGSADAEALAEWFTTEMPAVGWEAPEARDGALVFLHATELSARHAGEGLKRTALVLFDIEEGVDFSLIVEEGSPD